MFVVVNKANALVIDTVNHYKVLRKVISTTNKLINPLLDCYELDRSNLKDMRRLNQSIESKINFYLNNNQASSISLYYRDLKNGHWVGFRENEKYSPASLLKLPILIAALKQSELDPDYLNSLITVGNVQTNIIQNIGSNNFSLENGRAYTIEQLLEYMIVYSDNQSKDLVLNNVSREILTSVFDDLGIDIFKYTENENSISVREYASYYRILYNATYLNKELSNKALEILSRSKFRFGILAGLPLGITVAHKFGERGFENSDHKQFHDTGIIYRTNRPYLLCVMVKGGDFHVMEDIVADLSKLIYHFK